MSKFLSLTVFVTIVGLSCWGCTASTTPAPATNTTADVHGDHDGHDHDGESHEVATKLCGGCGDEKGSESCCSETAAKCDSCGLNKGSALCCVELEESVAGKDMCGKCGHAAGTEQCCAADAEKCSCGMAKGSPLCCKVKLTSLEHDPEGLAKPAEAADASH